MNNLRIKYTNGITMQDYYGQRSGSFLATKLFTKLLIQFASSGKMIFSNKTLIGDFSCTERGLQIAMAKLEEFDFFHRIFEDDSKATRKGFRANINNVLDLLSKRPEDVSELERGDLNKSIVNQIVITVKKDRRALKAAITRAKNQEDRERFYELTAEMRKQEEQYQAFVDRAVNRYNHFTSLDDQECEHLAKERSEMLSSWGFNVYDVPPELKKN